MCIVEIIEYVLGVGFEWDGFYVVNDEVFFKGSFGNVCFYMIMDKELFCLL